MSSMLSITISPTPAATAPPELGVTARVAVDDDRRRVEPGPQREVQLAGGRDVAAEALLREQAHHRRARERLGRERDLEVVLSGVADRRRGRPAPALRRSSSATT